MAAFHRFSKGLAYDTAADVRSRRTASGAAIDLDGGMGTFAAVAIACCRNGKTEHLYDDKNANA